ncbi:MAG: hypothetical protein MSG64_04890 [Pyrinomonadaceae bacterium MAG19_C2-C3]|nr:hypothetical protein [Pyrinomonadaceae bacterium MAG19_C2-C3]
MNNEQIFRFINRLLIGDVLALVASWASIISLGLTIYVAWNVRILANKYIFRLRAPQFIRMLNKKASTLIDYANDFKNFQLEIGDELARMDVRLKAMQRRMRGESKKDVKELRARIKDCEQEPDNEAKFRLAYRSMQRVIEGVKEYQEELNLE